MVIFGGIMLIVLVSIASLLLGGLLGMWAWNTFVVGVLGFSRMISLWEGMAGQFLIFVATGAVRTLMQPIVYEIEKKIKENA